MSSAYEITPGDIHFAAKVSHLVAQRLPRMFSYDDLSQIAKVELIRAAAAFDQSKGASFRTFAAMRIRGACLMAARRRHWIEAHHEQLSGLDLADRSECVDHIIHNARLIRVILKWASELPQPHRSVFQWLHVQGVSRYRVAKRMRWNYSHVEQVEHEAIAFIRAEIQLRGFTRDACIWT